MFFTAITSICFLVGWKTTRSDRVAFFNIASMYRQEQFDAAHWDYVLSLAHTSIKLATRRKAMEALNKDESPESAFCARLDQFLLEYSVEWSLGFLNNDYNEYKITNIAEYFSEDLKMLEDPRYNISVRDDTISQSSIVIKVDYGVDKDDKEESSK